MAQTSRPRDAGPESGRLRKSVRGKVVSTTLEVGLMEDLVKVVGVLVASSLFLLGLATLIQLVEQLIREPGPTGTRH